MELLTAGMPYIHSCLFRQPLLFHGSRHMQLVNRAPGRQPDCTVPAEPVKTSSGSAYQSCTKHFPVFVNSTGCVVKCLPKYRSCLGFHAVVYNITDELPVMSVTSLLPDGCPAESLAEEPLGPAPALSTLAPRRSDVAARGASTAARDRGSRRHNAAAARAGLCARPRPEGASTGATICVTRGPLLTLRRLLRMPAASP